MRTVAFYCQRAAERGAIAKQISLNEPRDDLIRMAQESEKLADEREVELLAQPKVAVAPAVDRSGSHDEVSGGR